MPWDVSILQKESDVVTVHKPASVPLGSNVSGSLHEGPTWCIELLYIVDSGERRYSALPLFYKEVVSCDSNLRALVTEAATPTNSGFYVHPCGQYRKNTIVGILQAEHGLAPLGCCSVVQSPERFGTFLQNTGLYEIFETFKRKGYLKNLQKNPKLEGEMIFLIRALEDFKPTGKEYLWMELLDSNERMEQGLANPTARETARSVAAIKSETVQQLIRLAKTREFLKRIVSVATTAEDEDGDMDKQQESLDAKIMQHRDDNLHKLMRKMLAGAKGYCLQGLQSDDSYLVFGVDVRLM
ncbi:hypothetical protein ACLOJK_018719 [Asimina triloba]